MNAVTSVPVTAAVFAALTVLLSGCMAYDAASTVASTAVSAGSTAVSMGTTAVSTTASVAGDVAAAPFGGNDSPKK